MIPFFLSDMMEILARNSLEQMFSPNNAMDRFGWCVSNGATGKRFLCLLWCAFIALRLTLFD